MLKNILMLIFKKEEECIELKRERRDRHPYLNIVRRRLTTAYRFAWNTGLVFDTFRFVTSIAKQSRAKSLRTRGTSASLFVMCNGLNVAHDGSSDHGAVRRGHGSKKEKKGSGWS
jgi:hypothetical protein